MPPVPAAGIPDFRSPDTGLYNNLMKYNLPYPQAIFELEYLYQNPKPFFTLAKELYPGTFKPTPSHYFVRLLEQKGLLVRHYTQNIDTLERIAGIHEDKIVEAHGTFYTNHCLQCKTAYSLEFVKGTSAIENDRVAGRAPRCCTPIHSPWLRRTPALFLLQRKSLPTKCRPARAVA